MLFPSPTEIIKQLREVLELRDERDVVILDRKRFRDKWIDRLAYWSAFHTDPETKNFLSWLIRMLALSAGVIPASIFDFYQKKGTGIFDFEKRVVPAINIRGMTYDVARAMFQAANASNTAAMIFEISRNELEYTSQTLPEFVTVILAAALKESFIGPVFLQGDHFQFRKENFINEPVLEITTLQNLIQTAVGAGIFNIDIDASTLVDLSKSTLEDQQRINAEQTAQMIQFIRSKQPKDVDVAIGGEIGEVGGNNTTLDELRIFLDKVVSQVSKEGLSKVSVQTGTNHGGTLSPQGEFKEVKIDFRAVSEISNLARSAYKLAGIVQHGASTLPKSYMDKFSDAGIAEIHLSTKFQNTILNHPHFPKELKSEIQEHVFAKESQKRKPNETDEQFLQKNRKFAWGPLKQKFWEIDEQVRSEIRNDLKNEFVDYFKRLGAANSRDIIADTVDAFKVLPTYNPEWKGWVS